jgi:hypothetical protein
MMKEKVYFGSHFCSFQPMVSCLIAFGLVTRLYIMVGAHGKASPHLMATGKEKRKEEEGPRPQYPLDLTSFCFLKVLHL